MSQPPKNAGIKTALILVSIILIISVIANFYLFSRPTTENQEQIDNLQTQKTNLENQVNTLQQEIENLEDQLNNINIQQPASGDQDQITQLQNEIANLETEVSALNNQIINLQNEKNNIQFELDSIKSAQLVTKLEITDERPLFSDSYIQITGDVWNVGSNTAYNCKLEVTLYQNNVIAKETEIYLGTITGSYYAELDEQKIYYEGEQITSYAITPTWD